MGNEITQLSVGEIAAPVKNALVGGPFGSDLGTADYVQRGVPVIRGQNLCNGKFVRGEFVFVSEEKADKLRANLARPGDLVLTQRGNAVLHGGQVAMVPDQPYERYIVSQSQMKLTPDQTKVDPRFLYFIFTSADYKHYLRSNAVVTGVPHINLGLLRDYSLSLPPLAEQKAIAAVLGVLDDMIELNRRMSATLEAMARALFQSWFVDFDPIRAKLDGRVPAGLDSDIANLFPEHFTHSEHDMLPIGWRHATIEEVCAINAWTLGKNDDLKTLEYVEISEVNRGDIANIATYARGEEPSRARRRLRHGDTALSTVRPDRGSYFLALNPPDNRVASTGFCVITPTKAPWSFIHAALTQPQVSDHLGQMADGGTYPAVRHEIVGAIQIVLPNESTILEAFHRICSPLFEQAEANRTQSRGLATLRDMLLPKLLSGKLSGSDATRNGS